MTRRERLERKAEKRREWAEARERKASASFAAAHKMVESIPLGQPILIGHHSEKRHRRTLDRCQSAMRAGSESTTMAHLHASKAAGIEQQLETCIFSDDDDAIGKLKAKIAESEKLQAAMTAANKIIRRSPKYQRTDEKIAELVAVGFSEERAKLLFVPGVCKDIGFPSYKLSNNNANIRRMKQRVAEINRRNSRTEAAEANGGVTIEGSGEWCRVTFADKPDYSIIRELKEAGFHWGGGSWAGKLAALPKSVSQYSQSEDLANIIKQ